VDISALVPNDRGFRRALAMRDEGLLDTIFLVFAESTAALVANGMTPSHEPLLEQIERTAEEAYRSGLHVSVFISTAYGCSVQGRIDPDSVVEHASRLSSMHGVGELVISDSVGQADPLQVHHLLRDLSDVLPVDRRLAVHFHDTRGAGLANVLAALMSPFEHLVIDGAFGGWGGDWPMLDEAFGNVASEDLLEMLVGLGVDTGVDVAAIVDITRRYAERTGRPIGARLPSASPIGWKHERLAAPAREA
jgi:isopropylmalate/homocitrate/citramalate synthase